VVLLLMRTCYAADTFTVKVLDSVPKGSSVKILNDHDYAGYIIRRWFTDQRLSNNNIGQIFMPESDFTMTGLCVQLKNDDFALRIDKRSFKIAIQQHSSAVNVEPQTILRIYRRIILPIAKIT
ncbi:unnamed protein product, partial [marine sediment metagenome]